MHISSLSPAWRLLYKTWLFKNFTFYPDFAPDTLCSRLKIRIIHPAGLVLLPLYIVYWVFTVWVIEAVKWVKEDFTIY